MRTPSSMIARPARICAVVACGIVWIAAEPAGSASETTGTEAADPEAADELIQRILDLEQELAALRASLPEGGEEALAAARERRLGDRSPDAIPSAASPAGADPTQTPGTLTQVPEIEGAPPAEPETPGSRPPAPAPERETLPPGEEGARSREAPAKPEHPATPRCNLVAPFDEDGDGQVNFSDRFWRFFRVWYDDDGDGKVAEGEFESTFAAGVRAIAVRLDAFQRKDNSWGDIEIDGLLILDLENNGVAGGLSRGDNAALSIDATALRRGDGPDLIGTDGAPVEGVQPFESGWRLVLPEGSSTALDCG